MTITNIQNQSYTEQQGQIQVTNQATVSGGGNYGTGYVQFAVSQNADAGDIFRLVSATDPNAKGAISFVGNAVYLGLGSSKMAIGTIDSVNNGQAGHPLKINFDNATLAGTSPVVNGDFSQGLTGWTQVLSHIDLGVTNIAGWSTPEAPTIKYPSNTPGGNDADLSSGFDSPQVSVTADGRMVLEERSLTTTSFGVVHGPAAYSDQFTATAGMVLKFDWWANFVNDDYHVVGYLLNTATGAKEIALQGYGTTGASVGSVVVPADGDYRFVFVSGTYDRSGGRAAGASMYIDNIRVEAPAVNDEVLQSLIRQVTYENTSDNPVTPTKTVSVSTKTIANQTSTNDFAIAVTGVNDPVKGAPSANLVNGSEDLAYTVTAASLLAGFSDPDLDILRVTSLTASSGTVVDNGNGTYTITQAANSYGNVTLNYVVTDGKGSSVSAIQHYQVVSVNDVPVATSDAANAVEDGSAVVVDVLANDTDVDAGDTKTLVSLGTNGTVGAVSIVNGKVSYDVGTHFQSLAAGVTATDTFTYTVQDAAGAKTTATVTMTVTGVNDALIAAADAANAVEDGSAVIVDVLANDTDADAGDTKTIVSLDTTGTVGAASIVDGKVSYDVGTHFQTLAAGVTATDTFTYTAKDASGVETTATVSITITGVNDAPAAAADAVNAIEDGSTIVVDVLANDTDVDAGDTKTLISLDTTGTVGAVNIVDGKVSYDIGTHFQSLAAGATATDTFTYTVQDAAGANTTASVTMTVTGVNDALTAAADAANAIEDGGAVVVDVLANDTDVDAGDTKTIVSLDTTGTVGAVSIVGGKVSYDIGTHFQSLAAGVTATDTFTYTAKDSAGVETTATVTMTVTGVNDAPAAAADAANAVEDGSAVVIDVLANDTDVDAGDTKTLVSLDTTGTLGAVSIVDGKVSYDVGTHFQSLGAGVTATDTFTYTVQDAAGANTTATVTMTVTGVNDALVAATDAAHAVEDGGAVVVDVLANDTDADAGDTKTLVSLNTTGTVGAASIVDGKVSYDVGTHFQSLAAGVTATDTFTYTAKDASGIQTTSTVTMTVTGINDAPVAVADVAETTENATIIINVLANDSDVDVGDIKTLASVDATSVKGATISIEGGMIRYNADADIFDLLKQGQSVTDSFVYTVNDTSGIQSSASVTVKVTGVANGATINGTNQPDAGTKALYGTALDESIFGLNGDDELFGNAGSDDLFGGNGDDLLNGGTGIDRLDGGNGNDVLYGGKGSDVLTGGLGNDVFVFENLAGSKDVDVITDFKKGVDYVRLLDGLTVTFANNKVDLNNDGAFDTELVLSNGGTIQVLGISGVAIANLIIV